MKHFKNGSLTEWQQIKAGDVISFESTRAKRVSFQVNANSKIEVWASDNAEMKDAVLQGVAEDKVAVEYTANASSWVQVKAEKGAAVFVNIRDVDQRIENSGAESYVNIEPRVKNNDEIARMMKIMQLNQQRMNEQLAVERAAYQKLRDDISKQNSEQKQEPVLEAQSEQVEGDDATGATTAE